MNPTHKLHELGQSLWLDNITRDILDDGTLRRYIDEYSVTGLTSNPSIFDKAIREGHAYDESIGKHRTAGLQGEDLFFRLAIEDLTRAADLFRPVYEETKGVDGWVSLELSPLLSADTAGSTASAAHLHQLAKRPNLYIKIPGTPEGVGAIEQSIYAGVPINVTLLFSREQYLASAEAYLRGVERRIAEGKDPKVSSVASVFVSRWDVAVNDKVPAALRNRLGIAIAGRIYKAYRELLASPRWQKLAAAGAWPQRLLWGSTGTKDKSAPDTMYIDALAAPDTVNTMPDATLRAFADHGHVTQPLPIDGGDAEKVLAQFAAAGVDIASLAERLQKEGADAFVKSWGSLLECLKANRESAQAPRRA